MTEIPSRGSHVRRINDFLNDRLKTGPLVYHFVKLQTNGVTFETYDDM